MKFEIFQQSFVKSKYILKISYTFTVFFFVTWIDYVHLFFSIVAFEVKNELFQSRRCLLLKSCHSFFFRNKNGITEKWVFVVRKIDVGQFCIFFFFTFFFAPSVRSASFARLFTSQTLVIFPLQKRNMHEIGAALAFTK